MAAENTLVWFCHGLSEPGGASGKEPSCPCRRCKRCEFDPWVGKRSLEEGMATHSSLLAWRIPWTEKPGGPQFMGLQRVEHYWSDLACKHAQSELEDIIKTFSLTFLEGELDGLFLDSWPANGRAGRGEERACTWETDLSHPWILSPTSHWCISYTQIYLHNPVNTGVSRVSWAGSLELLVWMWFWTSCLGTKTSCLGPPLQPSLWLLLDLVTDIFQNICLKLVFPSEEATSPTFMPI